MAYKVERIYTENPFVDEIVYTTKILAMGTVLKNEQEALKNETLESLSNAELYISSVDGTAGYQSFTRPSREILTKLGIPTHLQDGIIKDPELLPNEYRERCTRLMREQTIRDYVEINPYYRKLNGQQPLGEPPLYVDSWIPPDGVIIDLSIPIQEMDDNAIMILENYGVLEDLFEEDPEHRAWLHHTGKRRVSPFMARRANKFDCLYVPNVDQDAIVRMWREKLDSNKFYVIKSIYSEAYKYDSDYYDNFLCVFLLLITMVDIISRVQEFIARKEILDIRSCQYIFASNGVPFFAEIPLRYQIAMVKNLHTLLKYKSTAKCMVDICAIFGMKNIKIFKYYILKDRNLDHTNDSYKFETTEGVDDYGEPVILEDLEKNFDLKFVKVPLDGKLDDYIRDRANYVEYDEITSTNDPTWDGGLPHEQVKHETLEEEFNASRTKYISIDTIYDITKQAIQQCYFFNLLFDNVFLENECTVALPIIEPGHLFKIGHIFTFLTVLTYRYNNVKDCIMDTHGKVLKVNGFNFHADLAAIAADMAEHGYTLHAKEQFEKWQCPKTSIPSMEELMNLFVNNLEVREELVMGMCHADNLRVYVTYWKLYKALCEVELTFDYYKNPETGELARDDEGDATFTLFLQWAEPLMYYKILELDGFDDDVSRNQFIANLIDSVVYALEQYIDTDEFSGLFNHLPAVSSEAIKRYIYTCINFYKSYKVDFLGLNTIYYIDDFNEGCVDIVDDLRLERFFEKVEWVKIYDLIDKLSVRLEPADRIKLVERVYLIFTKHLQLDDKIDIWDEIPEWYVVLALYSVVFIIQQIAGTRVTLIPSDAVKIYELASNLFTWFTKDDKIEILDRCWIYDTRTDDMNPPENPLVRNLMDKIDPDHPDFFPGDIDGRILVANEWGGAFPSVRWTEHVDGSGLPITESGVKEHVDDVTVPQSDINTQLPDTAADGSGTKVLSETAVSRLFWKTYGKDVDPSDP